MRTRPEMSDTKLSIIIPVLNERSNLKPLLAELFSVLRGLKREFEVLIVDDGSTDSTEDDMTSLIESYPHLRYLKFRKNFGKAAALHCGIHESSGSTIVTMDGDGQDDPAMIPDLLSALEKSDLVVGWKAHRKDATNRKFSSLIFNRVVNAFFETNLHDHNCGLKVGTRELFEAIPIHGELHRFIPALASSMGFVVSEVKVNHRPRLHGKSKYGFGRHFRGAFDLITAFTLSRYSRRPLHLIGGLGAASTALGSVTLVYLSILWLQGHRPIGNRPLLAFGIMLLIVGVQFIVMGIIGELVASQGASKDRHYRIALRKNI